MDLPPIVFDEEQSESLDALFQQQVNEENDPRSVYYKRILNRPHIPWLKIGMTFLILATVLLAVFFLFRFGVVSRMVCLAFAGLFIVLFTVLFCKRGVICLIHIYQRYAPDNIRNKCRFEPSCSEYMILAIEKYGLFCGIKKGVNRLFRCKGDNGGFDNP